MFRSIVALWMVYSFVAGATTLFATLPANAPKPAALYAHHCASCHGTDRLGGTGPALIPQSLRRLKRDHAIAVVTKGRPATQMPAFEAVLDADQIESLVGYMYRPLFGVPKWGEREIARSRIVHQPAPLPAKPVFDADLMNLFIVVETGDHHATLLDGDTFTPIHRFPTRFALHGGPKYTRDGRFVFFASRDGWISKYDIYNLKMVAEVRAGINTRNAAVSPDGRFVAVGNYLPHNVVILSGEDLRPLRVVPATGFDGRSSRVSAVYTAPPRDSFIVALKDIPEVWEIPYRGDDIARVDVRRIAVEHCLDDFFFDQKYRHLMGATRPDPEAAEAPGGQVVDLDRGAVVASLDLAGMPHLGSGIKWDWKGRRILATPNLKTGKVSFIDMDTWKTTAELETLGPGFFMRSHRASRYAWVDVFFGPHRDKVHVIDKQTLTIAKTLQPEPGKTAAHVEFTKDGKYALLSVWDLDGAVIVYDAETLREVKRLPMKKPSGKYNVFNKTRFEEGTSH
ncbi:C-type cytochrome [Sulfidibacter corallicola]|uniref:C-type cytochrome n=2 Tax=Sulfidibacter corallicola TaxID=2818388 RepID=A0A8A4TV31_SULCO|nr:nitrite reductase [Sulfidibacter corallicola]QTD50385.1 c-type cytochrome [Sulfidibacter corallicola]